ncbi:MAG: hypothetical protein QM813_19465 [Verrucomicrobiota bacterium]
MGLNYVAALESAFNAAMLEVAAYLVSGLSGGFFQLCWMQTDERIPSSGVLVTYPAID